MNIITVDESNLESEHICCAISDKKGEPCVASKKAWLRERFAEGYVFQKLDVRGKAFLEYTPAENAWCPIEAEGYLFIDCFWISGQFKGQGYANLLLNGAIAAAREQKKHGLVALSSHKKMPFLSDPAFYAHKGFAVADTMAPFYTLLCLPLTENAPPPRFKAVQPPAKEQGAAVYYSNHCPHTAKYLPLLQATAERCGAPFAAHRYESREQAQNAPNPFTTYALFYNGEFVTNEIYSEKKFEQFLRQKQEV